MDKEVSIQDLDSTPVLDDVIMNSVDELNRSLKGGSQSVSIADVIRESKEGLLVRARNFQALGNKARIGFWNTLIDIYIDRQHLLSKDEAKSFGKFVMETFQISRSTAYSDAKVVAMLSTKERRPYLESAAENLNFKLREIASAPERDQESLLGSLEELGRTEVVEKVKEYSKTFRAERKADKKAADKAAAEAKLKEGSDPKPEGDQPDTVGQPSGQETVPDAAA